MRVLLFDPFHGAAGDMVTGSLLAIGADHDLVAKAMGSLVAEPVFSDVSRAGLRAVRIDTRAGDHVRTLDEVLDRVRSGNAPREAIDRAVRVFERMAAAEEKVHGSHPHFHEVGADDAIADILGACTALYSLKVDAVAVLPVLLGGGTGKGSHGIFPVPPPATLNLLSGTRIKTLLGSADDGELCTPTGAALLAEFSTIDPEDLGEAVILANGYGAGIRDPPHVPNVLRAVLMDAQVSPAHGLRLDVVDILETNVDDISGEVLACAISRLMEAGARDASSIPCVMKKGRSGHLVRVISFPDKSRELARVMARELGTLGIRCVPSVHRFIADRTIEMVPVEIRGIRREMPVKCGWMDETCYLIKAEFDPARDLAGEAGIPVREVTRIIEETARECFRKNDREPEA
ncbi:MAG: nickel pincer cofactor biosynthesis protein LarC [Methanoregulaceae archaeon]